MGCEHKYKIEKLLYGGGRLPDFAVIICEECGEVEIKSFDNNE